MRRPASGRAERLRAEADRIAVLLVTCEQELARIATARQVVAELPPLHRPAAGPGPAAAVVVPAPRKAAGPPDGGSREQLLAVLARYAGPVRCRQVAADLGLEEPRQVEMVRHRLKKAAAAGAVVQTPGGLFTLARGAVAATG